MSAQGVGDTAKAEQKLTGALTDLRAVAENYPTLRATENFQQLSRNLSELEDEIQASRRIYNSNVQSYNTDDPAVPRLDHRQPGRLHGARVLRDRGRRARAGLGQLRQRVSPSKLRHDRDTGSDPLDLRQLRVHLRPGDRRSGRRHPARNGLRGHPQGLVLPRLRGPDLRLPPARAGRGLEPPRASAGFLRDARLRLDSRRLRLRRLRLGAAAGRKGLRSRCWSAAGASRDEDFAELDLGQPRRYFWAPRLGMQGIFRLSFFKDIFVVSGSGVGGGSLGYANTLYRPPRRSSRTRSGPTSSDWEAELAPHYDTAERMLGVVESTTRRPGRPAAQGVRRGDRRRRHLHEDPGRRLLRPARARRCPTHTSAARARRGPAACAAAAAWSAAATAPRTPWSRTTSGSPRSCGVEIDAERTVTEIRPLGAADGCDGYAVASERSGLLRGRGGDADRARRRSSPPAPLGTNQLLAATAASAARCRASRIGSATWSAPTARAILAVTATEDERGLHPRSRSPRASIPTPTPTSRSSPTARRGDAMSGTLYTLMTGDGHAGDPAAEVLGPIAAPPGPASRRMLSRRLVAADGDPAGHADVDDAMKLRPKRKRSAAGCGCRPSRTPSGPTRPSSRPPTRPPLVREANRRDRPERADRVDR